MDRMAGEDMTGLPSTTGGKPAEKAFSQRTVDLKSKKTPIEIIEQYVALRNKYHNLINSREVSVEETIEWLSKSHTIIYGIIEGDVLLGVVVIYVDRDHELTFFSRTSGKGIGTVLLKLADEIAKEHKIEQLWAWTFCDNVPARKSFIKNGWILKKEDKENSRLYFERTTVSES
jgi:hypothetical protein